MSPNPRNNGCLGEPPLFFLVICVRLSRNRVSKWGNVWIGNRSIEMGRCFRFLFLFNWVIFRWSMWIFQGETEMKWSSLRNCDWKSPKKRRRMNLFCCVGWFLGYKNTQKNEWANINRIHSMNFDPYDRSTGRLYIYLWIYQKNQPFMDR